MFSISRSSTHSVRILKPALGTLLWYCPVSNSRDGELLYLIVNTDTDGNTISFTESTLSNECFTQSKNRDGNGWRNCYHSYTEGTLTVLPVIDNVTYSSLSKSDVYVESAYSHYVVDGTCIHWNGYNSICKSQESYHANYWWNSGSWMYEDVTVVSGGSSYTITENITASKGSYWYDRRGTNVTTYSLDPHGFQGHKLKHWNTQSIDLTTTVKNRLGTTTKTEPVSVWMYRLGVVAASNDCYYTMPNTTYTPIEDPETFVSDLMLKLPAAQANSYMNIADLRKFKELIPPIKALIQQKNIKSLADLYLWWKYTYNTNLGDLKSYYETFQRIQAHYKDCKQQTISLTYPQSGGLLRYNVLMDSFIEPIWNTFGFNINLGNTWDCIPFSFVLDWFVNVGSTLESIDNVGRIQNLNYSGIYRSFSRKTYLTVSIPNVIANVVQSTYIRERLQSLPIDVVSLHLGNPTAHLLDGSSLVVSNKKRYH